MFSMPWAVFRFRTFCDVTVAPRHVKHGYEPGGLLGREDVGRQLLDSLLVEVDAVLNLLAGLLRLVGPGRKLCVFAKFCAYHGKEIVILIPCRELFLRKKTKNFLARVSR